jgi:hypothetical protein
VTATTSESILAADGTVPADDFMLSFWDTLPPATPTTTAIQNNTVTAATPIPSDDASGEVPIDNVISSLWDAVRPATPAATSILAADGRSTVTTGRTSTSPNLVSSSLMSESTSLSRIPAFPSLWPPPPTLLTGRAAQQDSDTIAVPSIPDAAGAVSQAVASSSTLQVSTHDPTNVNSEAGPSNSDFVVHLWNPAVRYGVSTGKKRRNTDSDNPEASQKRGKR